MRGGNMKNMMKQVKKMQKEMESEQQKLDETIFTGTANNDLVTVDITGDRTVKKVNISEEIIDPEDKDIMEDLVLLAVNDALEQIDKASDQRMGKYTDQMNIPGF